MVAFGNDKPVLHTEARFDDELAPFRKAVAEPLQVGDAVEVQGAPPGLLSLEHPGVGTEVAPVSQPTDELARAGVRLVFVGCSRLREGQRARTSAACREAGFQSQR